MRSAPHELNTGLIELTTERLRLRAITMDDADALTAICSDRELGRGTLSIPHPYTRERCVEFIKQQARDMETNTGFVWGIEIAETGELIGDAGLRFKWDHQSAEAGFIIGKQHWNQGYCTEALRRIIDFGFENLGLYRIEAHCMFWNTGSERVMRKAGMLEEGVLRGAILKWGHREDAHLFGITRPDWEAQRKASTT